MRKLHNFVIGNALLLLIANPALATTVAPCTQESVAQTTLLNSPTQVPTNFAVYHSNSYHRVRTTTGNECGNLFIFAKAPGQKVFPTTCEAFYEPTLYKGTSHACTSQLGMDHGAVVDSNNHQVGDVVILLCRRDDTKPCKAP